MDFPILIEWRVHFHFQCEFMSQIYIGPQNKGRIDILSRVMLQFLFNHELPVVFACPGILKQLPFDKHCLQKSDCVYLTPSKITVVGHYRSTSETPFKWRFACGPILAHNCMLSGHNRHSHRQKMTIVVHCICTNILIRICPGTDLLLRRRNCLIQKKHACQVEISVSYNYFIQ